MDQCNMIRIRLDPLVMSRRISILNYSKFFNFFFIIKRKSLFPRRERANQQSANSLALRLSSPSRLFLCCVSPCMPFVYCCFVSILSLFAFDFKRRRADTRRGCDQMYVYVSNQRDGEEASFDLPCAPSRRFRFFSIQNSIVSLFSSSCDDGVLFYFKSSPVLHCILCCRQDI